MALSKPRNVGSHVEEMLQCSVCLDTVREPQTLQNCLHSYCKECTDQLQHKQNNQPPGVKCPLCGQFSGKDEIRHNFFIKELVEIHRSDEADHPQVCEQCHGENGAHQVSWKCLDCRMVMCDLCKKAHLRIKLLQDHRVVAVTSDEEADLVVDQLVFCTVHQNKPIELYCKTCKIPICIKCRLTTHDEHKSESIEEALEKIVPEIKENTKNIDEIMESTKQAIGNVEDTIDQSKKQFKICHEKVNETAEERIKEIQIEQQKLNDKLTQQENLEVEKLVNAKTNLEKKLKEAENLKRVVLTSLDKARHATLLNELVEGRLQEKIRSMTTKGQLPIECKVNMPNFEVYTAEWTIIKQSSLLGKLILNKASVIVAMWNVPPKPMLPSAKYWSGSFQHYFANPLNQTLDITLPDHCPKLTIIKDTIWVPLYQENINLYSKNGQLLNTINITRPVCVEEAYNGDIFIACHSGSGLHMMTSNNPVKLCDGDFSDICSFNDKVYVLEYNTKSVIEFSHDDKAGNRNNLKWTQGRQIPLNNYRQPHRLDVLIVTNPTEDPNLKYVYVSSIYCNTIDQYNEQGQQIQQFGSHSGQGEGKLSVPYLCGVDSQSHLLVADAGNKKYKILDPESGQWSDTGMQGRHIVYNAKIDRDGALWLSEHDRQNYVITKYVAQ